MVLMWISSFSARGRRGSEGRGERIVSFGKNMGVLEWGWWDEGSLDGMI